MITGGASGMGRAMAERFAEANGTLLLLDVDKKGLDSLKEKLPAEKTQTFKVNLANKQEIDSFWGNLDKDNIPDILINNAGIFPMQDFQNTDDEFLSNVMDINLNSVFWMCQHFIRKRDQRGGIIINISSIEAMVAFKSDMAHYAVSKAGVLALTRALARDYGKKGFRVNAIMPGGVNTPGTKVMATQALRKLDFSLIKTGYDFKQRLSLGRIGEADHIAKAAIFLASDLSSYVHGACLPVDGGFLSS